jgi:hypothetical protein
LFHVKAKMITQMNHNVRLYVHCPYCALLIMAKYKEKLNLLVLISNTDLNNVDPLLFCHCDGIFNGLKYFHRFIEMDC